MPSAGMLLQVDGSHHAWLEQRGPRFALLLAVDDATGAVVHALFRPVEDARGYFLLMEQVLRRSGIPLALYSDRHAVFRASAQQRAGREGATQIRGRSAGCPAPPAQIRTCALTHPAPALSVDGKSLRRPRVEDGHGGPVLPAQGVQTFPWVACPLRPSADSPHPEPPQRPHELRQRRAACGHRVIAKPSAKHPSKPPCCHHRVVMHAPTQLGLDGLEGPAHPLRDRFPAQTEAPIALRPAVVREAEEVERLRSTLPALPAVRSREPAELQQARLLRVHSQPERCEPFPHPLHEPHRITAVLKPEDEVIGISHDVRLPPPFAREPAVQHVVQVHVRQQRRYRRRPPTTSTSSTRRATSGPRCGAASAAPGLSLAEDNPARPVGPGPPMKPYEKPSPTRGFRFSRAGRSGPWLLRQLAPPFAGRTASCYGPPNRLRPPDRLRAR